MNTRNHKEFIVGKVKQHLLMDLSYMVESYVGIEHLNDERIKNVDDLRKMERDTHEIYRIKTFCPIEESGLVRLSYKRKHGYYTLTSETKKNYIFSECNYYKHYRTFKGVCGDTFGTSQKIFDNSKYFKGNRRVYIRKDRVNYNEETKIYYIRDNYENKHNIRGSGFIEAFKEPIYKQSCWIN